MISQALMTLHGQISEAAGSVGRKGEDISLVAVTKTIPLSAMKEAVACGITVIGENRVQEAQGKLISKIDLPAEWHFIGHLQTNKAKAAVALFDMIQSLDTVRLARALDRQAQDAGKIQSCLVELKVSDEDSKFGVSPECLEKFLEDVRELEHLSIEGLMTVAPYKENPENARPYFQKARKCFERAKSLEGPRLKMKHLSMGMSHDFCAAIQEGATMVRIGEAIFGRRPVNPI